MVCYCWQHSNRCWAFSQSLNSNSHTMHVLCADNIIRVDPNISPESMANPDDPCNSQRGHRLVQDDQENISSPHQPPVLRHRSSTGQLNQMAYPATPISTMQNLYSQWSQSPNISPYWQPAPAPTYHHYQGMPPPTFPASHPTLPTPTPSDSATAGLKPYVWRLTVDKKLAIVFKAIDKDVNWTFSEFLYYAFRMQTKNSDTKKLR